MNSLCIFFMLGCCLWGILKKAVPFDYRLKMSHMHATNNDFTVEFRT